MNINFIIVYCYYSEPHPLAGLIGEQFEEAERLTTTT